MPSNTHFKGTVKTQSTLAPSSIPYSSTIQEQEGLSHVQVPEDPLDSDFASTVNPTVPRSLGENQVSPEAIESCFNLFVLCLQVLPFQVNSYLGSTKDICRTSPY
jgi:hypothetical protein